MDADTQRGTIRIVAGLLWLFGLLVLSFSLWGKVVTRTGWIPVWIQAAGEALSSLPILFFRDPLILWGAVSLVVFYLCGRTLIKMLLPEKPPPSLCVAAGTVIISLASLFLGSIGLYRPLYVVGLASLLGLVGLADLIFFRKRRGENPGISYRLSAFETVSLALVAIVILLTVTSPTLFYDAVSYHLALPRQYLMDGSTAPFSWHPFSFFPSNAEMCFGVGMAGGGPLAAQLISGGVSLLSVLMIRDTAVRFVSQKAGGGVFIVALCTLTFLLSGVMVTADPFVLLLCMAGLFCVCGAGEAVEKGDGTALRGWLMGWAVMAGGSAGVKYNAWITGLALQWLVLFWICRKAKPHGLRLCAWALVLSLLVLLPWPLRSFIAARNPVMPVPVPGLFDGIPAPAWEALKSDAHSVEWSAASLFQALQSPWKMVFSDWETLAREFGAARFIGPFLWMGAPLLLLFRKRPRVPGAIVIYGLTSILISLLTFRMIRFAQPGIGAFVIIAGAGLYVFLENIKHKRLESTAGWLVIISIILLSAAIFMKATANMTAGYRYPRLKGDLSAYMDDRASINRFETSSIPLQLQANHILPSEAYLLFMGETRSAYCERRSAAFSFISSNPLLVRLSRETPEQAARSIADMGFTHVLVNSPELERLQRNYGLLGLTQQLENKVTEFLSGGHCKPVLEDEAAKSVLCSLLGRESGR